MKLTFVLLLAILGLGHSSHAYALDCTKASSSVEKLFCTTPELKKADESMSAAYFKLLRETVDPDFHEALIRSQQRWLKIRSGGPDRFGQAENDKTDDRVVLLKMTLDRLNVLRTATPIRTMEHERKIASSDSGGRFAGYRTYCVLQPPPYGSWSYQCWGEIHRQNNDRVCSVGLQWASGHKTEYRLVSVLKNGEPKSVASCSTGYADTSEECPDSDDHTGAKADAHWNTNSNLSNDMPIPHEGDLWKYDPDIQLDIADQQWTRECLNAPAYPPRELSRPASIPEPKLSR
jgi:uncharacterized protein YecT (DUF1311 family)